MTNDICSLASVIVFLPRINNDQCIFNTVVPTKCCLLALLFCLTALHMAIPLSSEWLHARLLSSWVRPSHRVFPTSICLPASVARHPACCSCLSLSSFLRCPFDLVWFVHLFSLLVFLALSAALSAWLYRVFLTKCRPICVLPAAEDHMTLNKLAVWASTAASVGLNVRSAYWSWSFLVVAPCFVLFCCQRPLATMRCKYFHWNTSIQDLSSVSHQFYCRF